MLNIAQLHIPPDRRRALAQGIPLPDRVMGAALFADISDYTPLTARLAQELGPLRGAEELTRQMNQVFAPLIQCVDEYGGSVIGFSGDAITCWFDGDDARRATSCGIAMQQAMQELQRTRNSSPLSLKVAIAHGSARRFLVGDPALGVHDVLAGATLDRLAAAEQAAEPGQVILDTQTAQPIQSDLDIEAWHAPADSDDRFAVVRALHSPASPTPLPATDPGALTDAQVRPFLSPKVYERILGGQSEFLAELRLVVAMFVRFGGIDYDAEDNAGDKLDQFVRRVQRVLERYEGTLLQITVGDKGSYFLVVFGAPVAHDDDPLRALSAAREISTAAASLSFLLPIQIGVSRGTMCAGSYGGTTRQSYSALGDETNVAVRLMEYAAPGQIVTSERLAKLVSGKYQLESLGALLLKGKEEPIPIYRVAGLRAAPGLDGVARPDEPRVGRAAEWDELEHALANLANGKSDFIVLEGEAGIGKSFLATCLLRATQSRGIVALNSGAEAVEQATPYFAWRALLQQIIQHDDSAGEKQLRERVLEILASDPALLKLAPLLNAVLPLELAENELTSQMSSDVRADNLNQLLTALVKRMSTPLLLVVEDVQWLDSASWNVLFFLARQIEPLLLLLTTRPPGTPIPPYYARLVRTQGVDWIELAALPPDDVTTLVMTRLGVGGTPDAGALPEQVKRLILAKAEGNPFFSLELVYSLRDAGVLTVRDGAVQLGAGINLSALSLPDTMQGVITSRIDLLGPSQQLALKVASVIGRIFAFALLRDVEPVEAYKPELPADLDILEERNLIELETPDPILNYHFKHLITQEVAYNLMLFSQRRELHVAIAKWYERTYAENLAPYSSLLTYHWSQAQDASKTVEYAERAGKEALYAGAYQEAADFFGRVLELESTHAEIVSNERRARVTRLRGEAFRRGGQLARAKSDLERAAELYGFPSPAVRGRLPGRLLGALSLQTRHRLRAPQPHPSDTERTRLREVAQIYEMLAELYFFDGQRGASLYSSIHMLNLAERAGTSPELARAYATTSLLAGLLGIRPLSETYYRRAVETAEELQLPATRADVERTNALYRSGVGQWQNVELQAGDALQVHRQLGDKRYWGDCVALLATAAFYQAQYDKALELYGQIAAEQHGNPLHQVWGLTWQGGIALRQNDLDRAAGQLKAAGPLVAAGNERSAQVAHLGFSALTHWHCGESAAALECADRAAALISTTGSSLSYYALDGYFGAAEVFAAQLQVPGLGDSARKHLRAQYHDLVNKWGAFARLYPIAVPALALHQGRARWLDKNPRAAQQIWRKGIASAQRLNMPYEQALLEYEIGRNLARTDPAGAGHLSAAAEIFAKIGAHGDLARVRAQLQEQAA